jgi:hypothetical protein
MATTVARLIEELQNHYDPNEPVIYQFITLEHVPAGDTDLGQGDFEEIADYLDRTNLADKLSQKIFDYIEIAKNNLPKAVENVAPNN